ncbi:MAG: fibronectin type III domain-containing protein, partial [Flavobacteriales bacterium]|nr:fibronectin type III domain-containing protein [Flavobacteriales bacterium]
GTGTIVAAGTNPYTLTGLTSSTSYDFWIQADCGADSSAYAGPSSFTTPFVCPAGAQCATLGTEISTDFDFTALPGTSTCPGVLSVTIPAGDIVDSVATFYDMSAVGGGWMVEQVSWLYSPSVGAGEAATSNGAGNATGTINYNRTGISFANTATGTVDFELHAGRSYGGAGCDNTFNLVEPGWTVVVYHSLAPSCFNPTALNAISVAATTANLGWTAGSNETQWNVEYGPAGFTPGTGTIANAVTTNPYSISGLTSSTEYDFYVQADCGADGTSNMAGPATFTTLCSAFTLPWSENFDANDSIPTCWSHGAANAENWLFGAAGGHVGNVGVIGGTTTSGNNFAWIDDSSPDNTGTTLESPLVDVSSLTVPMLSFYLISNNEGNAGTNVNFSVDVWDGAAWNSGVYTSNTNTLNGEWQQISVVLSSLTITGPVQLRFVVDEDPTGAYFDDVAIDDVTFVEAPACPDPTLLTAVNITTTSADLGWTENGSATTWDIEYGVAPYTATGTPTIAGTATNPHNLTGLTSGTSYDFYVRADCGGTTGTSQWTGPYTFTTAPDYCAGDNFYDNGGLGGNYLNNSSDTTVICPETTGDVIEVIFNSFATEAGYDSLVVYNGSGTGGTSFGTFDGTTIPGPFVSTDVTGCLTFVFYSDGSVDDAGWDATVNCVAPCAGLTVDLGADVTLCSGQDSVVLDAGAGPYNYEWTTQETTQTIVASSSTVGTVEYSVLITDTVTMCQAIDTVNVTFDDCSNISELTASNVSIYPNPSNGNFIVSLSNISEQVSVQVNDMQGRLIYSQVEGLRVGKENAISLENVERGVYLISVSSNKGRYTQSIVVQ